MFFSPIRRRANRAFFRNETVRSDFPCNLHEPFFSILHFASENTSRKILIFYNPLIIKHSQKLAPQLLYSLAR
jgi:hypothetical protein